nr:chorion peroxidase [Onthophagus taurus]
MKTERTALLVSETPNYAFESSITRKRKQQLRIFQICFCSALIFIFIIALIISTTLSLDSNETTSLINDTVPIDLFFLTTGILSNNNSKSYNLNSTDYKSAINSTLKDLEMLKMIENQQPILESTSPSYKHQMVTSFSNKSKELAFIGYMEEIATRNYALKNGIIPNLCVKSDVIKNCSEFLKYRSYDGVCNNLLSPNSGSGYSPFRRVIPPIYSDGIGSPRNGINNSLPSPRTVSNVVHRPYFRNDPKFTVMLAVFGQFLDHDITATVSSKGKNLTAISCCEKSDFIAHPECFPVIIDPDDPYYSNYNITCMNFVRSARVNTSCLGVREQMNQVSSYIDGSVIYGPTQEVSSKLRTFQNGLFNVLITQDNRTLLPISHDLSDGCNRKEKIKDGKYCFMSGDARANENVHLTTMHLIWTRHHNNLAKRMHSINPHWSDERIFQETRKILIAQLQHITYNEFLNIILGNKLLKKYELSPRKRGFYKNYNNSIDATISNNFATASFRFGHSLIPTLVSLIDNDKSTVEYLKLHEILFDPFLLYKPGEMDRILKGTVRSSVQAHDPFFTPELKEHLFENKNQICGLDLVSLNIQRGRDHGLPGYTKFREICQLKKVNNFDDIEDINQETVNYIRSIYRNVDDIDLYTDALSENPESGSMLGPTLNCLVIDQFARLKRGDRHYYENTGEFDETQLAEIRKTMLAKILCENSDGVKFIQRYAMENIGDDNREEPCEDLPQVDLKYWKENAGRVHVPNRDMAIVAENIWHRTG